MHKRYFQMCDQDAHVRVTIVGLHVHAHIRQVIAKETNGQHFSCMSESHLAECLSALVPAPAALQHATKPTLVLCLSFLGYDSQPCLWVLGEDGLSREESGWTKGRSI